MGGIATALVTIALIYFRSTGALNFDVGWIAVMVVITILSDTVPKIGGKP